MSIMTSFADNFWGEKNNGFFVLYHNMKQGQTASKEFIEFLRESCNVEENYSKLLTKLAKNVSNCIQEGTFSPFWNLLKSLVEKLATLHMQLVYSWSELIKDVVRYNEEQHKRHKNMKETESATLEVVQSIQQTTTALHKAKELYHTRVSELERLKRDGASQKDTEKAESKFKKASDEYRSLVDKYAEVRSEFERKMSVSCDQFQQLEEEHICQMKDFIDTYSKAWENEHILLSQVHTEFRSNCDQMTVHKMIQTFIKAKATGLEKPGPKEFVEPDLSCLPIPRPLSPETVSSKKDGSLETEKRPKKEDSSGSPSPVLAEAQPGPLSRSVKLRVSRTSAGRWFLKSKRDKKKESKKKKKREKDENLETDSSNGQTAPDVDDEGYSRQPDPAFDLNGDKTSWNSSESDSDSEGDSDVKRKIKVEIRPLSPNGTPTGTVEDIRASIEGLRLSPTVRKRSQTPIDKKMKRSQSESDTLDPSKPSHDLLKLDLFNSSAASTPTGGNSYNLPSPLVSSRADGTSHTSNSGSTTTLSSSNASDAAGGTTQTNHDTCILPAPPPSSKVVGTSSQATSPVGSAAAAAAVVHPSFPLPPRPPSRTKTPLPQVPLRPGRVSPALLISPPDGTGSMFNTTSSLGSSRGSSPLTLGMADVIPMAVAFTENINANFKGTDATKCSVSLTGNLMMSFPAGIIKVLTENPSPSMLSFRVNGAARLEHVRLNTQLISQDTLQSTSESSTYTFDMTALTEHLRAEGEINKSASYFNVDILKYQVKPLPGVDNTPLPLVVYWKCTPTDTNYRLDYKYNPSPMSLPVTLKNIQVTVPIDGQVSSMQSIPAGNWNSEDKRATWKLPDISELSENGCQGCIRAKFETSNGPNNPSPTALQFIAEGATLSGLDFELVGFGYRLSLVKKRFGSGKYLVEPDPDVKYP